MVLFVVELEVNSNLEPQILTSLFMYNLENEDDFHRDCVEEVKRINGAINFPFRSKDGDELDLKRSYKLSHGNHNLC